MAWTKKQLAEARRLFKRPGNKLSWSDCVGKACKGATRKPAAKKATAKKPARVAGKKVVKRTVIRKPVSIRISGVSGAALGELQRITKQIQAEETKVLTDNARSLSGLSAAQKREHRASIAKRRKYISELKTHARELKKFV